MYLIPKEINVSLELFKKSQLYTRKSLNLSRLNFDFSNTNVNEEYLKIQSLLYTRYHIECESMLTIMKEFNIPSSKTMDILFRLFDIEARSLSEATSNALTMNRNSLPESYKFIRTYHKSWFGEIFYLRSSYELEVAKHLDQKQIKYFVEHLRIKYFDQKENKYRIAIPDFYLPESNTIIEVKSSYWLDNTNMENKKKAYNQLGYKFILYLDHKFI